MHCLKPKELKELNKLRNTLWQSVIFGERKSIQLLNWYKIYQHTWVDVRDKLEAKKDYAGEKAEEYRINR
mgnify:CR=1 FL=1